jgi:intracellular septation protein
MDALLNFAPLALFLATYRWRDIYAATAVLMAAMLMLCAIEYLRLRRVSPMQLISTVLVLGLGTATLVLRDPRFLKWKPTIFMWLLAAGFLLSPRFGGKTLAERLLHAAMPEGSVVPARAWSLANWQWVACYLLLGAANLWVAFNLPEATWVNFKVFGLTVALMLMAGGQAWWLTRQVEPAVDGAGGG